MRDCFDAGAAVLNLIKRGIRPRDIMTQEAFENAITVVIALGGSTNAVLHLLAMAHAAGVKLTIDDFTRIGKTRARARRPQAERQIRHGELVEIGGTVPLMKMLLDAGLLHGDCLTVTGKTMARKPRQARETVSGRPGDHPPARATRSRRTATSSSSTATSPRRRRRRQDLRQGRPERFTGKARVFESEETR